RVHHVRVLDRRIGLEDVLHAHPIAVGDVGQPFGGCNGVGALVARRLRQRGEAAVVDGVDGHRSILDTRFWARAMLVGARRAGSWGFPQLTASRLHSAVAAIRSSRAWICASGSHWPRTITPTRRCTLATSSSGLASSRTRSARRPGSTVPNAPGVPK